MQTPNLEEGEAIGGRGWYYSKERWSIPISLHAHYSSIITRLPEILDCSFQWGLRTPDFGEGEAVRGTSCMVPFERTLPYVDEFL